MTHFAENVSGVLVTIIKKLTRKQVIEQFKEVHGDRYDYSLVEYYGGKVKVKIICPEHGVFEKSPEKHKAGEGCKKCSQIKLGQRMLLAQEQAVTKFKEVHGDRYDYSLVEYVKSISKVKIICPKHGVFEQSPNSHISGHGCPKCQSEALRLIHKSSDSKILSQFAKAHGDKYNYSLVEYVNFHTKVKIICPEHGVFEQSPANHQKGIGCPKCGVRKLSDAFRHSDEDVVKRFKLVYGDKYDYSLMHYVNNRTKVKIICPEHGMFEQSPENHKNGYGCPSCLRKEFTESSLRRFNEVHGNKYDYSLIDYIDSHSKVKIICPEHGVFEQNQSDHKMGKGCPKCADYGFDLNKPAILYYLRVIGTDITKIGITNRTLNLRFSGVDLAKLEVVKVWRYGVGKSAYDAEQLILKQYKQYKYEGESLLESGNSELFDRDVLGLVNNKAI